MIDWNSRKPLSIDMDGVHNHIDSRQAEFGLTKEGLYAGVGPQCVIPPEEAPRPRGIRPNRAVGHILPKMIASLDIGGSKDPSVLLVLRVVPAQPPMDASRAPDDLIFAPTYVLERAVPSRLGMSYAEMADLFSSYLSQPEMAGALAVLDRTGLGRPVFEMIAKRVKNLIGVTFTSGGAGTRGGRFWNVPKLDAVAALQLAMPRISVPALAQGAAYLRSQLEDFGETRSKSGQSRFGNVTQNAHDDAVTGLMMAVLIGDWLWRKQAGLVNTRRSGADRRSAPRR